MQLIPRITASRPYGLRAFPTFPGPRSRSRGFAGNCRSGQTPVDLSRPFVISGILGHVVISKHGLGTKQQWTLSAEGVISGRSRLASPCEPPDIPYNPHV